MEFHANESRAADEIPYRAPGQVSVRAPVCGRLASTCGTRLDELAIAEHVRIGSAPSTF